MSEPTADMLRDEMREVANNARAFERELIIAKLEAEMFGPAPHDEPDDGGYRDGWNDRAASIVRELRGGR